MILLFCRDFIFDNERLSDHGFIICSFEDNNTSWDGGDITFTTMQSPNSNSFTYYTSKFETPITFTFQICKNPCMNSEEENMYLSQDEQSYLMRWLQRLDGYHWFAFDQDGWEDVWFHVQINPQPYYISDGKILGYSLTCTADSPYGYSQVHEKEFVLKHGDTNDTENKITIKNYSDIPGNIYPKIEITPLDNGTVKLNTGSKNNKKITEIKNAVKGLPITLDKENDLILGIANMNNFNYVFPIMSNEYKDINTVFTNIGDVDVRIKIEYRFVRRVTV